MGINASQLREAVVRPALKHIGHWSQAAENLVMGTCAQESRLGEYIVQIKGPALGIFQMEPVTHADLWDSYLDARPVLADHVRSLIGGHSRGNEVDLVGNLHYAAAMCRVHYLRVRSPLPGYNDVAGLAAYWKRYYNTPAGRGTEAEFIKNYALTR